MTRQTLLLIANALGLAQTASTQTAIVPGNFANDDVLRQQITAGAKALPSYPNASTGIFHRTTNDLANLRYVVNTAAGSTVVATQANDSLLERNIITQLKALSGATGYGVTGLES